MLSSCVPLSSSPAPSSPSNSQSTSSSFHESLSSVWTNLSLKSVSKDWIRLAQRCDVYEESFGCLISQGRITPNFLKYEEFKGGCRHGIKLSNNNNANEDNNNENANQKSEKSNKMDMLRELLLTIVFICETSEVYNNLFDIFETYYVQREEINEYQLMSEELLSALGEDSKSYKIIKCLHQSIIFPAVGYLVQNLYSSLSQMKDVRDSYGWLINITLSHNDQVVRINHKRADQSVHPINDPCHFECLWELNLSFQGNMKEMTAVFLRIQKLKFKEDAPLEWQTKVSNILRGNGYIVV